MAKLLPKNAALQPLDYTGKHYDVKYSPLIAFNTKTCINYQNPDSIIYISGPGGPRFDALGMVLPHSILGNLEDFRKEMEARGETEVSFFFFLRQFVTCNRCIPTSSSQLVKRIPNVKKQNTFDSGEQKPHSKPRQPYERDHQGHALNHWCYHMVERRRQQNFISSES